MSDVWRTALVEAIAFMKAAERPDEAWLRRIEVGDGAGWLLPVCRLHRRDDALIARLSRWRDASQFAFPTRFPVTEDGTRRWLDVALLERADRMLFLVTDAVGAPIGHVGLVVHADAIEADNIVRGEDGAPGLMGPALLALLAWAEQEAALPEVFLRVLDENAHAIGFYHRLGFVDGSREDLRRAPRRRARHADARGPRRPGRRALPAHGPAPRGRGAGGRRADGRPQHLGA